MKRSLSGSNLALEHRKQLRLRTVIDRRFARLFRAEIARAMRLMIDQYRVSGSMPDLPDDHNQRLTDIWRRLATVSVDAFGERIIDQGKSAGLVLETKELNAEFFLRLVDLFLENENIRQRIASVTRSTRETIVNQVLIGQDSGLGVDAIARSIDKAVPLISRTRAALIARTETHGAANFASDQAAESLGLPLKKQWVAVEDDRTRGVDSSDAFSHIQMNSVEPIDKDMPFEVPMSDGGFEPLMYPGDLSGSAGNIINCRCIAAYIVKE